MTYPMKLTPAFKDYLWGGAKLVASYGKETDLRPVAEAWEVSCHPDGPSVIANGEYTGQTLTQILADHPSLAGTKCQGEFPVLIKLIDASSDLSLQVHPNDEYARKAEGQLGKNEMWYIVDREPGARIVLGFSRPVTREEFAAKIADNTILDCVNAIPVEPGDCYCIPAGMLHAIGGGILVAEVQQSSNVTYRVYDYDRRDADGNPRPLHIEKALDVTDSALTGKKSAFPVEQREGYTMEKLCDWRYFQAARCEITSHAALNADPESFHALVCLDGALSLSHKDETCSLKKGESLFVPAGLGDYTLEGKGMVLFTSL